MSVSLGIENGNMEVTHLFAPDLMLLLMLHVIVIVILQFIFLVGWQCWGLALALIDGLADPFGFGFGVGQDLLRLLDPLPRLRFLRALTVRPLARPGRTSCGTGVRDVG